MSKQWLIGNKVLKNLAINPGGLVSINRNSRKIEPRNMCTCLSVIIKIRKDFLTLNYFIFQTGSCTPTIY